MALIYLNGLNVGWVEQSETHQIYSHTSIPPSQANLSAVARKWLTTSGILFWITGPAWITVFF
jgi:hypothetical protein